MALTTNLSLDKPTVGGDTDTWGTKLNTVIDGLDAVFKADGTGTSVGVNVGAGKTLAVAGTLSGAGVSTYLASPPAIGGTTAAAGSFTNLSSSGTVSGTGFSNYLAAPPAIGGTTPAAGSFTSLSATAASTVVANSTSAALRVTQTGTGNAILVEDEANPDSTPFVVDATGQVGIGTTTPTSPIEIVNSSLDTARFTCTDAGATTNYCYFSRLSASPANNDYITSLIFTANNSVSANTGYIRFLNRALNVTSGSEQGQISIQVRNGASYITGFQTDGITTDITIPVGLNRGAQTTVGASIAATGTGSTDYAWYAYDSASTALSFLRADGGFFFNGSKTQTPAGTGATTANAANLYIGTAAGSNQVLRSTSSIRYKQNVQDATYGLPEVLQLRPVTYQGINDGDKVFGGFIAEEVDAIGLSQFVVYDNQNRPDALAYGAMVSLLTKAIQQQNVVIEDLKARVAALEAK